MLGDVKCDNFVNVNDWIKLDRVNDKFVSRKPIPKGTRILIERPLFKIAEPPKYQPLANVLFLFSKFKALPLHVQGEILIQKFSYLEAMYHQQQQAQETEQTQDCSNASECKVASKCKDNDKNGVGPSQERHVSEKSGPLRILYPLEVMNNKITDLLKEIKKAVKSEQLSKYVANAQEWKRLEMLLNVFERYAIDLHFDNNIFYENSSPYQHWLQSTKNDCGIENKSIAYYNDSMSQTNNKTRAADGCTQLDLLRHQQRQQQQQQQLHTQVDLGCTSNVTHLGKALFRYASQLGHSCAPTCNINVIDEIGTIEVRTLCDIKSSNVCLTRNFLHNTRIKSVSGPNQGSSLNYFASLNNFENSCLVPCQIRRLQLFESYHLKCNCSLCSGLDRTRGFRCKQVFSSKSGCDGIVRPRGPNGTAWQCETCRSVIKANKMRRLLRVEKELQTRLIGLEQVIEFKFRAIDKKQLLYDLLHDATARLSVKHWIVMRLIWICFEAALNEKNVEVATVYLKRHLELVQEMSQNEANSSIANECELLADLADLVPTFENEKIRAIQDAIDMKHVLRGECHSSVKRCKKKLMRFENERKMSGLQLEAMDAKSEELMERMQQEGKTRNGMETKGKGGRGCKGSGKGQSGRHSNGQRGGNNKRRKRKNNTKGRS